MLTRHVGVRIWIDGKDISEDISNSLEAFTYEDVLSGETDSVEITLDDAARLFIGDWFPARESKLEVELWRESWQSDNLIDRLPLGIFELDEVNNSYPPSVAKVKGNSCASNSELRQVAKSKAWENVKLSQIASDVAAAAGVELFYDTEDDPEIKRAEQSEVSRLAFLKKLCEDNGLALKVADGKLIIFDEAKYEQQEPIATLEYGSSAIKHFDATVTLTEIYKACEVNYKDGKADEKYSARFEDATKSSGKTLKINQRVDNQAAAEKLARKKLREKNKGEIKISVTTVGRFEYLSGSVIELKGHGFYNGRYLIERARHKVGSGYEVSLELRKCLSGY